MRTEPASPTESEQPPLQSRSGSARSPLRWALPFLILIPLMLLLNFSYLLLRDSLQTPMLRLVVNGEVLQLDATAQRELADVLPLELTGFERDVAGSMQHWIDTQLDSSFSALDAGVDDYLDWHFSAGASYMRLAASFFGTLDEWTQAQVQRRLVDTAEFDQKLASVQNNFASQVSAVQQARMQQLQQSVYERFAHYRQSTAEVDEAESYTLDFDSLSDSMLDARLDSARMSASVGGGFAGGLIARRFVTGPAMHQGRVMVTRFLARLGVQAGRSAAVAGGAAGASAPATGPGAIVVGGVVFAGAMAAFIGTEYLALNAQEKSQRPQLEAQLRADIANTREEFSRHLQESVAQSSQLIAQTFISGVDAAQIEQQVPERYWILNKPN